MEGHGGLPSAADVQGKSPPQPQALPWPPALPPAQGGQDLWLVPKLVAVLAPLPPNSVPWVWLIPHLGSNLRETAFNQKKKPPLCRAQGTELV